MDITLIPKAESKYDKKLGKSFILDAGIVQLSDCSLILLHKAGLRPLYVMEGFKERILHQPTRKLSKPDLILFCNSESGRQSAFVVQEQLKRCGCNPESKSVDFSTISKTNNFKILKNRLSKRTERLSKAGYKHLVVIADSECLDKIAACISGEGLPLNYNIPIYSFSNGKEIKDVNLTGENMYVTRELLDSCLMRHLIQKDDDNCLEQYKDKCFPAAEFWQLRNRLRKGRS